MHSGKCINNVAYDLFCSADLLSLQCQCIWSTKSTFDKADGRVNPVKKLILLCILVYACLITIQNTLMPELTSPVALSMTYKVHPYYCLWRTECLWIKGTNPEIIIHIFKIAICPVLIYGLQNIYQNKASLEEIEKLKTK